MKSTTTIVLAVLFALALCIPVHAEDQIFTGKAERVTRKRPKPVTPTPLCSSRKHALLRASTTPLTCPCTLLDLPAIPRRA